MIYLYEKARGNTCLAKAQLNMCLYSCDRIVIFISYSHKDKRYLDRLKIHLRSLDGDIEYESWDDTRIQAGQIWNLEIDSAVKRADAAILLVTADFIASDFIGESELPPLLEAAKSKGICVLPIVLKPCGFARKKNLSQFEAASLRVYSQNLITGIVQTFLSNWVQPNTPALAMAALPLMVLRPVSISI